jgi:hypothetical protein
MFYDDHGIDPTDPYYNILNPTLTVNGTTALAYLGPSNHEAGKTYDECQTDLGETGDLAQLQQQESDKLAEIVNIVTQTDTPIEKYLDSNEDNINQSVG